MDKAAFEARSILVWAKGAKNPEFSSYVRIDSFALITWVKVSLNGKSTE